MAEATRRGIVENPADASALDRLMRVAIDGLPRMYLPAEDIFCFTRAFTRDEAGDLRAETRGTSLRYSAIVALGAYWLPEADQRRVLGGRSLDDFIGVLVKRVSDETNLGDAALVTWAAAEGPAHAAAAGLQPTARARPPDRAAVRRGDAWVCRPSRRPATSSMWRVTSPLPATACSTACGSGSPMFPHVTGPGLVPGTARTWAASPTRCTRSRRWPGRTRTAATRRRWRPPNRGAGAHLRAAGRRTASGGGTTTRAPAASSRATRSTASTSTRWPRWRCSTSPTRAATTSARRSAVACAG